MNAQYLAHTLECLFVNARGLISENGVLKTYINDIKIDTMGVAETFYNEDVMQAEVQIVGYTTYRQNRCSFKVGNAAGLLLYIRNDRAR